MHFERAGVACPLWMEAAGPIVDGVWFLLACGYGSYYPDASHLPIETGEAAACSAPTEEAVALTVIAQTPVALTLLSVGVDCGEAAVTTLSAGQPWQMSTFAGVLYRVRTPDGNLYDELQVPGGAATYRWEIP